MASKRRIRRNECDGKIQYPDAKKAHMAIRSLHRSRGYQGTMNAYRCSFCKQFHIGHSNHKGRI